MQILIRIRNPASDYKTTVKKICRTATYLMCLPEDTSYVSRKEYISVPIIPEVKWQRSSVLELEIFSVESLSFD